MIFGISGTKRTVRNRERCTPYRGVRKERLDCTDLVDILFLVPFSKTYLFRVIQKSFHNFMSKNSGQIQNFTSRHYRGGK